MSQHYTVTVVCQDCRAIIRYEDERPDWQQDEPDPDQVTAAEAYVAEHPRGLLLDLKPALVRLDPWSGTHYVDTSPSERYVICPGCDGRAYLGSSTTQVTEPAAEAKEA